VKDRLPAYIKKDRRTLYFVIVAIVIIVFALLPFYVDVDTSYLGYFLFVCFCYMALAQGWNLVGGYTGQISLGSHAFFALGAYTTAIIWVHNITHTGYYFDPVVMILSGIVPAIFAIIIGIPLLYRLSGDYFSFGTLAAAEVLRVLILKGGDFTQGAGGLRLPSIVFTSMKPYYWTSLLLAVLATAAVYFIIKSRLGLAFRSIMEDETSAASHGISVLGYKILSFAMGSFIMGVVGSLYAYYLFTVQPSGIMNLNWLFIPILICVLGGNGTVLGPVIGAFVIGALFSFGDVYVGKMYPMVSGILIILVMKYMPTGIIGLKDRFAARRQATRR
jgi:branched-chain amino acid transport system permease protein